MAKDLNQLVIVTKSKLDALADQINSIRGSTTKIKITDMQTILQSAEIWENTLEMYARDGYYSGTAKDINLGYAARIPYYCFYYGINTGAITGNSVQTIYKRGLGLSQFLAINFPNLKSLSYESLAGMSNLKEITLKNLTYLDQYAIKSASEQTQGSSKRTYIYDNLETIHLGSNVSTQATINLDLTNFNKESMPKLKGIWLDYQQVPINNATLSIPTGELPNIYVLPNLVDQYKTATNWSLYADYIKAA